MWHTYFDRIVLLNLVDRPDRLEDSIDELNDHKIPFEWFRGVKEKNGELGVYKSLVNLFSECLDRNDRSVLVFEDDVQVVCKDFEKSITKCIEQLPADWEMFLLGLNLLSPALPFSPNLFKVQMSYALHGVAYSKSFMEQFLKLPMELPVDRMIAKTIMRNGKTYCSYPMLVNQRLSKSSINDYSPELPGLRPYWDETLQCVNWGKFMTEQYEKFTRHITEKNN